MIGVAGLSHHYRGAPTPALEAINLTIPAGSCFGLLGPNGAGKTTLISLLTGVLKVQIGQIALAGSGQVNSIRAIKACSALVPQDYAFYPSLTGRENLNFFLGLAKVGGALRAQRLAYCADICGLSEILDKRASRYSGGMKRRLNIAIGLVGDPSILYLDEPTVGIDAESRHFILQGIEQLRDAGKTIVYTSHYMEEVEQLCDQVAIIDRGRLVLQQPMAELLAGGRQLLVTLQDTPSEAQLAQLAAQYRCTALGPQLSIEPGEQPISAVIALLESLQLAIIQIHMGRNRLEPIYLAATRHGAGL